MTIKPLDFSGQGTASNSEIEDACDRIITILKEFNSPKDAGGAFTLAQYKLIIAAFPPECQSQAIEAVKASTSIVIELLLEG